MNNINNKNNITPYLFTKKIYTNYKLIPFNISVNDVGRTKYLPPVAKEWKNSVYNYNSTNAANYPIYDLNVNSLIKGYFNMYLNHKFLEHKYISRKKKRKSLSKIFVSKAEIKHTNSKAIITIYVYNREKLILLKKINRLKKIFLKLIVFLMVIKSQLLSFSAIHESEEWKFKKNQLTNFFSTLFNYLPINLRKVNKKKLFPIKRLSIKIFQTLGIIKNYRLKLSLNKHKFEEKFLYKLSKHLSKYYGKKVEFNIVNIKSIAYNGDIFTEILTSKVKKEKTNPIYKIYDLLSKVVLPKENKIKERGRIEKSVDLELIDNKYKNLNISSIIEKNLEFRSKNNLNKLLYNLYNKTGAQPEKENKFNLKNALEIRNIILDNIKYKNMGGAKLIVKGRLTKRYRADRAVYKLKWKGGLKNIDSAFKGLSTVVYRGYMDSNVEKSKRTSKRRIGSFAVRGWFSGK